MGKIGTAVELAALLGLSKAAIGQGIKKGRLKNSATPHASGRGYAIDLDKAVIEWGETNGRPDLSGVDHRAVSVPLAKRRAEPEDGGSEIGKALSALMAVAPLGDDGDEPDADGLVDSEGNPIPSSVKSRRILDHFKAQQARLDYQVAVGALVPIDEVAQTVGKEYASVRAALLAIPSRIADELIGLDDKTVIRSILEAAITESMAELTAYQEAPASERAA